MPADAILVIIEPDGMGSIAVTPDHEIILVDPASPGACGCCTICSTLRRHDACALSDELAPCAGPPAHVWVCEPSLCPTGTVKHLNRCYTATEILIAAADLPAGDILLVAPPCRDDCHATDCTECQLWLEAVPCPGQVDPPRVFFPYQDLPASGCGGFGLDGLGCYRAFAGPGIPTEFLPPGAVLLAGAGAPAIDPDFLCCGCLPGCSIEERMTGFYCGLAEAPVNLRCCCPEERTVAITYSFRLTTAIHSDPSPANWIDSVAEVASQTIRYRVNPGGSRTWLVGPCLAWSQTDSVGGVVISTTSDPCVPMGPIDFGCGCGGRLDCFRSIAGYWPGEPFNATDMICPSGGPWVLFDDGNGNRDVVVTAESLATCASGRFRYRREIYAGDQRDGSPRQVVECSVDVRVTYSGRCGGGCSDGQSAGSLAAFLARARSFVPPVIAEQPVEGGRFADGTPASLAFLQGRP